MVKPKEEAPASLFQIVVDRDRKKTEFLQHNDVLFSNEYAKERRESASSRVHSAETAHSTKPRDKDKKGQVRVSQGTCMGRQNKPEALA